MQYYAYNLNSSDSFVWQLLHQILLENFGVCQALQQRRRISRVLDCFSRDDAEGRRQTSLGKGLQVDTETTEESLSLLGQIRKNS
jgi:hypothetical protein